MPERINEMCGIGWHWVIGRISGAWTTDGGPRTVFPSPSPAPCPTMGVPFYFILTKHHGMKTKCASKSGPRTWFFYFWRCVCRSHLACDRCVFLQLSGEFMVNNKIMLLFWKPLQHYILLSLASSLTLSIRIFTLHTPLAPRWENKYRRQFPFECD